MESFRRITYPPSTSWAEYELETLEDNANFMRKVVLSIAIFGCIAANAWTVYFVGYLIDRAYMYPDNRAWLLIGVSIILAVVINGLTILLGYRVVKEGNETA